MTGQVVEIVEDNRYLSVDRGFLVVSTAGEILGRVALDLVDAVVGNAHGLTWSSNLALELANRNIPMIFCGANHQPQALLWPVSGHYAQAGRMRLQLAATAPLHKRLWQSIVQAKIRMQGAILEARGLNARAFESMAQRVKSGDPDNLEAQAARRYWPLLMGDDFRRDTEAPGINGMLNYGYAILRSAAARAVMACGLHPSLGIFHCNPANPLCLVDDLMEPFRPLVDWQVVVLTEQGNTEVNRESKRRLAAVLELELPSPAGSTPASTHLLRLCQSLASSFENSKPELVFPLPPSPLTLAGETEL